MRETSNAAWPVLTEYDQDRLARIALPLGGIGTGTISLGGRGDLRDWEIMDRPAKGFTPPYSFFALYAKAAGKDAVARVLEGPIEPPYDDERGFRLTTYGLPRFRKCSFRAAYPFGQVLLSDPDIPIDARIEGFNPLIPGDADRSGIPAAILRFVLTNKTNRTVQATVCGTAQNFLGVDPSLRGGRSDARRDNPCGRVNRFRKPTKTSKAQGLFLSKRGMDPNSPLFGTMALATTARSGVTHRTGWMRPGGANHLCDFWSDLSDDGELDNRRANPNFASLAASVRIPPKSSKSVTFLLTWHFPNRRAWSGRGKNKESIIGNYYAAQYRDAWDVAVKTAAALPKLEAETLSFVRAFCQSDLPAPVKDAALCNVSTLRTQTCFRTTDGRFFGFEGCLDDAGCCPGSCTHVWNYEQTTPFLFADLARTMREVEMLYMTDKRGHMGFRIDLPLRPGGWIGGGLAAADGQMGAIMKVYREWQLSGDDETLRRLWPRTRKALEYCWIEGGWDADRDGVMEGCQHTTTDFEYFGPNPIGTVWYLGALRACEEMARYLGQREFAELCRGLFVRGSRWVDENLFNGEYYEQEIRPPKSASDIAPGLKGFLLDDVKKPAYQIGTGCLSDQLVGQFMAHVCGLGHLLNTRHVKATLRAVMKHCFKKSMHAHPAYFRAFALNDESALVFGAFPKGDPEVLNFRFPEVLTGCEYAVAVHMFYEGLSSQGLKVVKGVRDRHDGRKRNPFSEPECGHHYARAMAAWGAVLALTGFHYSAVEQSLEFARAEKEARWLWSTGSAWGTVRQKPRRGGGSAVELTVLHGALTLKRFSLAGLPAVEWGRARTLRKGRTLRVSM
jgi:non-lysosomal glucosylceramidase